MANRSVDYISLAFSIHPEALQFRRTNLSFNCTASGLRVHGSVSANFCDEVCDSAPARRRLAVWLNYVLLSDKSWRLPSELNPIRIALCYPVEPCHIEQIQQIAPEAEKN